MKRWFFICSLGLLCLRSALGQTALFWQNDSAIIVPPMIAPQVDALNFINSKTAILSISFTNFDFLPLFDTTETLNFTNRGLMAANTGFRFDTAPARVGLRRWADNFDNSGEIDSGTDTNFIFLPLLLGTGGARTFVASTNIAVSGTIHTGFESLVSLTGDNVNLSRSHIFSDEVGFAGGAGFFFFNQGFVDGYWGADTNVINPDFVFSGFAPTSPFHLVLDRNYVTFFQSLPSVVSYLDETITGGGSNRIVRAVFVNNTNAEMIVNVYFPTPTFFGADIVVEWVFQNTNINGVITTNFMYLFDSFGANTNFGLVLNGTAGARATFIPVNYDWLVGGGQLPVGTPDAPDIVPFGTFNADLTTNQYSAYEALFRPTTRQLGDTPGQDVTNMPGRIEITANKVLDLTLARISSINYLKLKATNHFAGNFGSEIVSPFTDVNLRVTNDTFTITNLLPPTILRPEGIIDLYSARWTNVVAGVTNEYHVLFVDTRLAARFPTRQQELILRTPNTFGGTDGIVLHDHLNVTRTFLIESTRLTIATNAPGSATPSGGINIISPEVVWSTALPRLQYLTNFGFIEAVNSIFFGGSRSSPHYSSNFNESYIQFINRGVITNFASLIWADDFQNSGIFFARSGSIELQRSLTATLTNGAFIAPAGDIYLASGSLFISNHLFQAGGAITISATNYLDDGSLFTSSADFITNRNVWLGSGFNILTAPALGSLLGTTISNSAAPFQRVVNRSAAADRGCVPAGFVNNAAVGRMILDGGTNSLFVFSPVTGGNALYIDSLELRSFTATNQNMAGTFLGLQVEPGMAVYFGRALSDGIDISTKLHGQSSNRFCWVSNWNCGFFSSTNLLYPGGVTNRVNTGLATSCEIDSDGDGVVNCMDSSPISGGGCVLPSPGFPPLTNNPPGNVGGGNGGGSTNVPSGLPTLPLPPVNGTGGTLPDGLSLAQGNYNGLFYDTNALTSASAGCFSAKTTSRGALTAKLNLAGRNYTVSGQFDSLGNLSKTIQRAGASPLNVELHLDLSGGDQIRGRVWTAGWSAELMADRQVFGLSRRATQAGTYTFVIPGDAQDPIGPGGDGFGTVKVDSAGTVTWSGTLADGTKVTQKSTVSKQGFWPLYASLYSGSGSVISWVQFAPLAQSDLSGQLIWIKPAGRGRYYPLGFTNEALATGSSYRAPMSGARALNLNAGNVVLRGGGLPNSLTYSFTLGLNNRVTPAPGAGLTLSIAPATGLFKGSAFNPESGKPIPFQGVLFKKANIGVGYFLGSDQSGEVYLSPAP